MWSMAMLSLLFCSCHKSDKKDNDVVLAEVNSQKILLKDAVASMPEGFHGIDSTNFVKEYLANKIKDILIYEKAKSKVTISSEIDSMVENYRRSLIVYEYQQQILNDEVKSDIDQNELMSFYNKNITKFLSDQYLVKGVFLKVKKDATNIDKLRQWCRKPNSDALDKIESYSVQNAIIYNYFMENWTGLEKAVGNMPRVNDNPPAYLKPGTTVESEDDEFCYLLYVKDCVLRGNPAPIEYIKPLVISVLINNKKTDFLRQYEQKLLNEAVKNGKVIYY